MGFAWVTRRVGVVGVPLLACAQVDLQRAVVFGGPRVRQR